MLLQKDDGSIQKTTIYTGSGRSPTSSLRDDRMYVSLLECSEVLTMRGVRIVKEIDGPKLGNGLPKGKL
jgi:hypothetical protein